MREKEKREREKKTYNISHIQKLNPIENVIWEAKFKHVQKKKKKKKLKYPYINQWCIKKTREKKTRYGYSTLQIRFCAPLSVRIFAIVSTPYILDGRTLAFLRLT